MGVPLPDLLRRHGIGKTTFFRWRSKYAGASVSDVKRLRELEGEPLAIPSSRSSGSRSSNLSGREGFMHQRRGLAMKLVKVEQQFDGPRLVFHFTAEARVDFRELVRELASQFRCRIDMRQIGARDEAKLLGGYGTCGRPLCCTTWLQGFEPISIKMAKQQHLSLNPSRLNPGVGPSTSAIKSFNPGSSGMTPGCDSREDNDLRGPDRSAAPSTMRTCTSFAPGREQDVLEVRDVGEEPRGCERGRRPATKGALHVALAACWSRLRRGAGGAGPAPNQARSTTGRSTARSRLRAR